MTFLNFRTGLSDLILLWWYYLLPCLVLTIFFIYCSFIIFLLLLIVLCDSYYYCYNYFFFSLLSELFLERDDLFCESKLVVRLGFNRVVYWSSILIFWALDFMWLTKAWKGYAYWEERMPQLDEPPVSISFFWLVIDFYCVY